MTSRRQWISDWELYWKLLGYPVLSRQTDYNKRGITNTGTLAVDFVSKPNMYHHERFLMSSMSAVK